MDDRPDPIAQFFPDQDPESVDLYAVLNLSNAATHDDIKKSYRKLALVYHPDKHSTASDEAKAAAALKFQQIGFAYTVLGDEKRRQRYDKTGRTDEGLDFGVEDGGWEAYFEELFDKVTKEKLDELKKEYQGSAEEVEDLKAAYVEHDGSIDAIMMHIPHSNFEDEARFIVIISDLIKKGELPKSKTWEKSIKDEKAKLVRKKQSEKEAAEAEELAKELGVWDEFYGSGKPTAKKAKGKGKGKGKKGAEEDDGEEDTSALQALILKKRKNMDSFFDSLAAKYAEPQPSAKGKGKKKRAKEDEEEDEVQASPKKRSRKEALPPPPEINDEEFEKLQAKLFPAKDKETKPASKGKTTASASSSPKKTAKGKRAR